jgi:hypothetical protein
MRFGVESGAPAPQAIKGKVQEEELDSCRAAGERGAGKKRDEGAGRNRSGFSLRDF